jgi:PD-(D/E)XK nuclease superfamily protein
MPSERGLLTIVSTTRGGTLRHLNQSELTTYLRCRRKWNWSYLEGFTTPRYNTNLSTGTAVHKALQAHYKGLDPFAALVEYWDLTAENILPDDPCMAQVAKDVSLSNIMMEGYLEWLAEEGADAGLTPVAVEEKVEMQLLSDVVLHGTVDLVLADPDGNMFIIDHKTTNAFGALADRRLVLNFQLLTYATLAEEFFGAAPAGAQLNMLRKVLRTGTAKPPFYQRESVHFNSFQLDNHRAHMQAIATELMAVESRVREGDMSGVWPVVDGDCSWKCPFLSVCPMADDGSDINGALNDLYIRRDEKERV